MVHKEVIHPVNSLHGSQGSNTSCKLLHGSQGNNTSVISLHGSQGSNTSC